MTVLLKPAVSGTGKPMIEVWSKGIFICGIYPHEGHINIISKFLKNITEIPTEAKSVDGRKVKQVQITFEDVEQVMKVEEDEYKR